MSTFQPVLKASHKAKGQKVYYNGNIITMTPGEPRASAFSVMGDHFVGVGSDEKIKAISGAEAELIDLGGNTVIPGFIETHNHLSIFAINLPNVDCSSPLNRSIDDVKQRIKNAADKKQPGRWVLGYGYDDTLIEERRHLTCTDLDEVSPSNPVHILHVSAHTSYTNSMALKIAGINADTLQPDGGEIVKDEKEIPTGVLFEPAAMDLVGRHIPNYNVSQLKKALQKAIEHFNRFGITSIHDGGIGYTGSGPLIIQAYRELEREGQLNLRVYMTIIEKLYKNLVDMGLTTGFGSRRLKLGSVKSWLDGSIQIGTAALTEPYNHEPDLLGKLLIPQKQLNQFVKKGRISKK